MGGSRKSTSSDACVMVMHVTMHDHVMHACVMVM